MNSLKVKLRRTLNTKHYYASTLNKVINTLLINYAYLLTDLKNFSNEILEPKCRIKNYLKRIKLNNLLQNNIKSI